MERVGFLFCSGEDGGLYKWGLFQNRRLVGQCHHEAGRSVCSKIGVW